MFASLYGQLVLDSCAASSSEHVSVNTSCWYLLPDTSGSIDGSGTVANIIDFSGLSCQLVQETLDNLLANMYQSAF